MLNYQRVDSLAFVAARDVAVALVIAVVVVVACCSSRRSSVMMAMVVVNDVKYDIETM